MAIGSLLTIDSKEYSLRSFSYSFSKQIGMDGKTASAVSGGEISVSVQTLRGDDKILGLILAQNKNDIKGKIAVTSTEGEVRTIEFEQASVSSYSESFSGVEGVQDFTISAGRMSAQKMQFSRIPMQARK
ncbi:type VI secretion system tube protein TssD [Spirosoma jeollabukense]